MKEIVKLASLIPSWPWAKVSFLLCLGLLYRGIVNFNEALILTMLAVILDSVRVRPNSRGQGKKQ